jgi:hypothetical protein
MSLFRIFLRVFALLATLTLAQAQAIQPRAALVIGNADYSFGPLRNPVNDAEAMARALDEAGFDSRSPPMRIRPPWRRRSTPSAPS